MIVDGLLAVSGSITGNTLTGQTVTGNGTTVVSANTIDLSQARDIGEGEAMYERVEVTTAFVGGTSVEAQIIVSASANLGTPTVIGTTGAIPVASLVAGARFAARMNAQIASLGMRYLGIQYVIVGNMTAGGVYADFGPGFQDGQKFYPSGFAVA